MRICLSEIAGMLEKNDKGTGITGYSAPLWDNWFGDLLHWGNHTINVEKGAGLIIDRDKQLYNGCLGSIQRNESDMAFVQAILPIVAPGVRQGSIFSVDAFIIRSVYNKTAEMIENDIADVFDIFSTEATVVIVCMLAVIFSLLIYRFQKCRFFRRQRYLLSSKIILGNVFRQGRSYYEPKYLGLHLSILLMSLSVFMFLIHAHFCSLIKTELVTVKKPVVIRTPHDLHLKKDVHAFIVEFDNELSYFTGSESPEHGRIMMQLIPMTFEDMFSAGSSKGFNIVEDMRIGKAVVLYRQYIEVAALVSSCKMLLGNPLYQASNGYQKYNSYKNQFTSEFLRGWFLRDSLEDNWIRLLDRRVTRARETSLEFGYGKVVDGDFQTLLPPSGLGWGDIEDCLVGNLVVDRPSIRTPSARHYAKVFVMKIAILYVAVVILISEIAAKPFVFRSGRRKT